MPHLFVPAAALAILLASPLTAYAQLVTFDFTATVSFVPPLLSSGPIADGQTVSGSFTFDPTVGDSDASAVFGSTTTSSDLKFRFPEPGTQRPPRRA